MKNTEALIKKQTEIFCQKNELCPTLQEKLLISMAIYSGYILKLEIEIQEIKDKLAKKDLK